MAARIVLLFLAAGALASAQPAQFSAAVRLFIKIEAAVVATILDLTGKSVIPGLVMVPVVNRMRARAHGSARRHEDAKARISEETE